LQDGKIAYFLNALPLLLRIFFFFPLCSFESWQAHVFSLFFSLSIVRSVPLANRKNENTRNSFILFPFSPSTSPFGFTSTSLFPSMGLTPARYVDHQTFLLLPTSCYSSFLIFPSFSSPLPLCFCPPRKAQYLLGIAFFPASIHCIPSFFFFPLR